MNREIARRVIVAASLGALVSVGAIAAKPERPPPTPTVSGTAVFSAGQPIGYLLSFGRYNYGWEVAIITATGHVAEFAPGTGALLTMNQPGLSFSGRYCNGDAYARYGDTSEWKLFQGLVFRAASPSSVSTYYVPKGATLAPRQVSSSIGGGYCNSYNTVATINAVPALPNDVAVTGVPDEGFALPIVFGIP